MKKGNAIARERGAGLPAVICVHLCGFVDKLLLWIGLPEVAGEDEKMENRGTGLVHLPARASSSIENRSTMEQFPRQGINYFF